MILDDAVKSLLDGAPCNWIITHRSLSIALTRRYLDQDPPPDPPGSYRLIGRLTPERVTGFSA
jgi:hypothetical protein